MEDGNGINFKEFLCYKHTNKDILPELYNYISTIKKHPKYNNKWKKLKEPNNWLTSRKISQDENEKLYSDFRSILNKLSDSNFDQLVDNLIDLNIVSKEHLVALTDAIFDKAKIEIKYSSLYAKLSKSLASYYIEHDGIRVHFRELLINKCQEVFEESVSLKCELGQGIASKSFHRKEEVIGFISFIGELYNNKLLTSNIINGCFLLVFMKATLNKPYIIDIMCTLMNTVGKLFFKLVPEKAKECLDMIHNIKNYPTITNKEKYIIMDTLDIINLY